MLWAPADGGLLQHERARELMLDLAMAEWSSLNVVLGPTMGDVGMCNCMSAMEL
jgi:hypothetical protein